MDGDYEATDEYRQEEEDDDGVFMDFSQVHQLRQKRQSEIIETADNPVYAAKEVEVIMGTKVFSEGDSRDDVEPSSEKQSDSMYYNLGSDPVYLDVVDDKQHFSVDLRDSVDVRKAQYMPKKRIRSKTRSQKSSTNGGDESQVERAKVLYAYTAENGDELTIEEGQIVTVLEKELVDSGWWKGEINGKKGVFPDNFVELLPPEEPPKPKRPTAPPASSSKPTRASVHNKPAPGSPAKHKSNATGASTETRANAKPSAAPTTTAAGPTPSRKPTMPPPLSKKPGKQQPDPKLIAQTDDHKAKEKTDKDLDAVETTERLSHPTANRAKAPVRRPPSQTPHKDTPGEENHLRDSVESPEPQQLEISTPRGGSKRLSRRTQPPPPPPPPKVQEELQAQEETDEEEEEHHPMPVRSASRVSFRLDEDEPCHVPRLLLDTPEDDNEPLIATPRGNLKHRTNPDPQYGRHKLPPLHMHSGHEEDVCLASSTSEETEEDEEPVYQLAKATAEVEAPQRQARPPAPTLNNEQPVIHENGGAGEIGTMVSNSEVESLRQEIAELRANTVSKEQYEHLKGDFQQLKENMERWQAKHSKLLTDLMEEVDEEKKIRLATEVEMKRIKKMVQP